MTLTLFFCLQCRSFHSMFFGYMREYLDFSLINAQENRRWRTRSWLVASKGPDLQCGGAWGLLWVMKSG